MEKWRARVWLVSWGRSRFADVGAVEGGAGEDAEVFEVCRGWPGRRRRGGGFRSRRPMVAGSDQSSKRGRGGCGGGGGRRVVPGSWASCQELSGVLAGRGRRGALRRAGRRGGGRARGERLASSTSSMMMKRSRRVAREPGAAVSRRMAVFGIQAVASAWMRPWALRKKL